MRHNINKKRHYHLYSGGVSLCVIRRTEEYYFTKSTGDKYISLPFASFIIRSSDQSAG